MDERHRRLLEFLIPILYPDKPTQVTVTMANTIFGALADKVVDWSKVLTSVVLRLLSNLGKNKTSPLSVYLLHLYQHRELLTAEELTDYNTGMVMLEYNCEVEPDPETLDSEEDEPPRVGRRKSIDPAKRGEKDLMPDTTDPTQADPWAGSKFFDTRFEWIRTAKDYHDWLVDLVLESTELLKCEPDKIVEALKARLQPEEVEAKTEEIRKAKEEQEQELRKIQLAQLELTTKLNWTEGELTEAQQQLQQARKTIQEFQKWVRVPTEMYQKTALYDGMEKENTALTQSKIIRIMVDLRNQMDTSLKDLRQLFESMDSNKPMDFSKFPDVPEIPVMGTPVRHQIGTVIRTTVGLQSIITQPGPHMALYQSMTTPNGIPTTQGQPGPSQASPPLWDVPEITTKKTGETSSGKARMDLTSRLNAVENLAQEHPEQFPFMQQPSPVKTTSTIRLDESEGTDVAIVEKPEEEEDESSPTPARTTRRVTTQAQAQRTPKTADKPPTHDESSAKKARKGR